MDPREEQRRARLIRQLEVFRRDRAAVLAELAALEPSWLAARLRVGKWSILEIVEHLVLAERSVFAPAFRPGPLPALERRLSHHLRFFAVRWTLRLHIPVPVPARELEPHGQLSLVELGRQWEQDLGALRCRAENLAAPLLAAPLFEHPVAGPLTFEQALELSRIHFDGHLRQIRERLERLAPPP